MIDCVFCKIVAKEIDCNAVYEDDKVLAFLDIFPAAKGHTLVIPKMHNEFLGDVSDEELASLVSVVKKVAKALGDYAEGSSILQRNGKVAGQVVPHVHFHVIPRSENDGVSLDQWDGLTDNKDKWNLKEVKEEIQNLLK